LEGETVVFDAGKTLSKLSLWSRSGHLVDKAIYQNKRRDDLGYLALDVDGIESWLIERLAEWAGRASISAIIPVGHGAAACVVRHGRLSVPPMDYEHPLSVGEREHYERQRDPFALTGSPALPKGLNLGAQLHLLDALDPSILQPGAQLLLWPQYWAWRLSGIAASEVSSLGCHTDLWFPSAGTPSSLAVRRGWAALLPPLRRAGDCLGTLRPEWSQRTGLTDRVRVHCGLHDSNAALLAARTSLDTNSQETTVLSTGTWFVAMRNAGAPIDLSLLSESQDCLVNVDVYGNSIPSARFMGGREVETLIGQDGGRIDVRAEQTALLSALPVALEAGALVLPTFAPGYGPFPNAHGRWIRMPAEELGRKAVASLYLALVADVSLDLTGSRDHLIIEGRFAAAEAFVRALAALRPNVQVYVANADNDVSMGALRLIHPELPAGGVLSRVEPLQIDLSDLRRKWRAEAGGRGK
jgi:sugar (pentulose or hexulose) kinase